MKVSLRHSISSYIDEKICPNRRKKKMEKQNRPYKGKSDLTLKVPLMLRQDSVTFISHISFLPKIFTHVKINTKFSLKGKGKQFSIRELS